MQQRIGFARVLIHDPRVLLLDEPASGLDPRARIEMMAILQELQRLGKTIIISSHILSELQTLCNRVAIIERGKLIYSGPVQGVRQQMSTGLIYWLKVSSDSAHAIQLLKTCPEVTEAAEPLDGRIRVTLVDHDTDPSCIAETLVRGGARLVELRGRSRFGKSFLHVTRGETVKKIPRSTIAPARGSRLKQLRELVCHFDFLGLTLSAFGRFNRKTP
jgi:ABC-2 type transport system ATP-binding protein